MLENMAVPLGMVNPWSVVSSSALCGTPVKRDRISIIVFLEGNQKQLLFMVFLYVILSRQQYYFP